MGCWPAWQQLPPRRPETSRPPGDFQAARPAYWFPLLLPAAVLLLSGLGALASGLRDRPR